MNLDQLAVRARLRSNWESVDLGILLARRHWVLMAALWLTVAAPLYLIGALLFSDYPNWVFFAIWWLKPLYERLPLLVVSRQLFGETIGWRQALGMFRQANARDWFAWLSWRRFSFTRAFDLPVTVLEGSTGRARAARIGVLHRHTSGTASWLHIVMAHVEMILAFGVAALIYLMLPEQLEIDWAPLLTADGTLFAWISNGIYLLILAAVAPFYTCGGFMLYIGRRVTLEAWDIEIHFRRLRARLEQSQRKAARKTAVASTSVNALLLCACLALASVGLPQPASADAVTPERGQELIDETLAGEEFHRMETVSGWRLKDFKSSEFEEFRFPDWLIALVEWLEGLSADDDEDSTSEPGDFGPLIAGITEVLLWTLALALIAYLLWQLRHHIGGIGRRTRAKNTDISRPQTLFGLDVRSESLPDDVTAEVLRLWRSGAPRDATSLLYRATLAQLISRFDCAFHDHHTEAECAQLVREDAVQNPRLRPSMVQFFALLTATWQQQAYAHRAPESARMEFLCKQWREVFQDEN